MWMSGQTRCSPGSPTTSLAHLACHQRDSSDLGEDRLDPEFLAALHAFTYNGAPSARMLWVQAEEWKNRRVPAVVVARFNIQHTPRVLLGSLPAVWFSEARSRPLSTVTGASWKIGGYVGRGGGDYSAVPDHSSAASTCPPKRVDRPWMLRGKFEIFDTVCGLQHSVTVASQNFPGQHPNPCFVVRN
jgi:hypothetical protein